MTSNMTPPEGVTADQWIRAVALAAAAESAVGQEASLYFLRSEVLSTAHCYERYIRSGEQ